MLNRILVALLVGASTCSLVAEETGKESRLLILRNGRVVRGRIAVVSSGYEVENSGQKVVIPRELVDLEAKNLVDAHRKLRSGMTSPTAAGHLTLARWCLGYGLRAQAMQELREALKLAPDDTRARGMLGKLKPGGRVQKKTTAVEMTARPEQAGSEALGGLPRDGALEFVRRVQPLLLNRCGMGGCHGAHAKNRFRLEHARIGVTGHRPATQRNLASVLDQVDFERVAASPLLTVPRGGHGRGGRPVFSGTSARRQATILKNWIEDVARSRGPVSTKPPAAPAAPAAPLDQGSSTPVPLRAKSLRPVHPVPRQLGKGPRARPVPGRTVLPVPRVAPRPVPLPVASRATDVFDPEVFNRETRRRQALESATSARRGPLSKIAPPKSLRRQVPRR